MTMKSGVCFGNFLPLAFLLVACQGCSHSTTQAGSGQFSQPASAEGGKPKAPAAHGEPQPSDEIGSPNPGSAKLDAEEQQMLVLINRHRTDQGLGALRIHPKLVDSSRWLSQDMAAQNYLSHTDSQGRDSFQRMDFFGFNLIGWRGENIACGNGGAERTYAQWLGSPGHDENMLNPRYNWIGIARAYGEGSQYKWYWTTDFGSNSKELDSEAF